MTNGPDGNLQLSSSLIFLVLLVGPGFCDVVRVREGGREGGWGPPRAASEGPQTYCGLRLRDQRASHSSRGSRGPGVEAAPRWLPRAPDSIPGSFSENGGMMFKSWLSSSSSFCLSSLLSNCKNSK